jgi:hypothetical protein
VFGDTPDRPFAPKKLTERADGALGGRQARAAHSAQLPPHLCQLHDRRRGERQGALRYMGHASIAITLDRYGHLMPGNEEEAAILLDKYLAVDRVARSGNPESKRTYEHGNEQSTRVSPSAPWSRAMAFPRPHPSSDARARPYADGPSETGASTGADRGLMSRSSGLTAPPSEAGCRFPSSIF